MEHISDKIWKNITFWDIFKMKFVAGLVAMAAADSSVKVRKNKLRPLINIILDYRWINPIRWFWTIHRFSPKKWFSLLWWFHRQCQPCYLCCSLQKQWCHRCWWCSWHQTKRGNPTKEISWNLGQPSKLQQQNSSQRYLCPQTQFIFQLERFSYRINRHAKKPKRRMDAKWC